MQLVNIFIIKFLIFCEANFHTTFFPQREAQALNQESCKPAVRETSQFKTHLKKKKKKAFARGFVTCSNFYLAYL